MFDHNISIRCKTISVMVLLQSEIIVSVAVIILGYWSGRWRLATSTASIYEIKRDVLSKRTISFSLQDEVSSRRLSRSRQIGYFVAILNFILTLMDFRSRGDY
jgi:hypothetical protein